MWNEVAVSVCQKNVLKGIHGDQKNRKLLSCVFGAILHVAVDIPSRSWVMTTLRPNGPSMMLSPGIGSAVYILSDEAALVYQQSEGYVGQEKQFTYRWDDPAFGIEWPTTTPLLSERDNGAKYL